MNSLLQLLLPSLWLQPLVKPLARFIVSLVAVPMFRSVVRNVVRTKDLDRELQRDLEQWFRGAVLLLAASANMEAIIFGWVPPEVRDEKWWIWVTRLLLAMGVIESMPDQALFSIIHPGPPKPEFDRRRPIRSVVNYIPKLLRGLINQHLNRSSPVLAIMSVIFDGRLGWICFGLCLAQYLVIGLVSSRDRAIDILQAFEAAVDRQRRELIDDEARSLIAEDADIESSASALSAGAAPMSLEPMPSAATSSAPISSGPMSAASTASKPAIETSSDGVLSGPDHAQFP